MIASLLAQRAALAQQLPIAPGPRRVIIQAMVQIDIEYQGSLRTQARHEPSGSTFLTDAPKDNQGNGEAFSPTDLLATALGTCMVTTMGIAAKRVNVDLVGTTVRVLKEMIATPTRRLAQLTVEIHCPASAPPEHRPLLERAALNCPVVKSLHPDVQIPAQILWDR
ncbi:MAG TPA: OsmC family protein [Tepidisphaeraceae bacterium]|nr:OsmC family protein [Tepidisphaeraceae bacterium]